MSVCARVSEGGVSDAHGEPRQVSRIGLRLSPRAALCVDSLQRVWIRDEAGGKEVCRDALRQF